jgi:hypothetical protein
MKSGYLINLDGQGDTRSALVAKEVFDWIERKDTPGREGDESMWTDTGIPESLHNALKKESFYSEDEVAVTIGSFDNDRAIIAVNAPYDDMGASGIFYSDDDEKSVKRWAREHGFKIEDSYVGGLY